ncbi:hybrid sensor histidine kinase/response regulator transcription factor [Lutibacter citreus]|uniref:hybrid sensor histidine kinase/response regulator transcription factor n=1 Tax=Lutibacter citreus TaxID=2138210 RepID=UPI000DBE6D26|nr:two-component regulator propeller domain-containing protein [Lutibacter citreus]
MQTLYAQFPDLKFEHFLDEKGFNQNSVEDILQDNDGYIWIGTPNGLYQYDGNNFKLHTNKFDDKNSLIDNSIIVLKLDPFGDVLIGTTYGLCKYEKKSGKFLRIYNEANNNHITTINFDESNNIWVGTEFSGIFVFREKRTLHFNKIKGAEFGLMSSNITAIVKDKFNDLWVGSENGLYKVIKKDGIYSFKKAPLQTKEIVSIHIDDKNRFWLGTYGNVVSCIQLNENRFIDKNSKKRDYLIGSSRLEKEIYTNMFLEQDEELIWVVISNYGLALLNTNTGSYKLYKNDPQNPYSLYNNRVTKLIVDSSSVLWVGSSSGGLHKFNLNRKNIHHVESIPTSNNTLSNGAINVITEGDNNTFFVGTENGLNLLSFKNNQLKNPKIEQYFINGKKTSNAILSMIKYEGDYWIAERDHISRMRFNGELKKSVFFNEKFELSEVYNMLVDDDENLWFASFNDGLVKWKKTKNSQFPEESKVTHYRKNNSGYKCLSSNAISVMYEDNNKNLWIGTLDGGLNLRVKGKNGESDTFINYQQNNSKANSLSHNSVFSIHQDKEGVFWIGTFGGGLNKMIVSENIEETPIFKHFRQKDGLANNAIYGILEDDLGRLWLSTDDGISCFDKNTEKFENYDASDGLQSHNFRKSAYYQNNSGYMFFGGLRGLNIFNPQELKNNEILPSVHITGLKINGIPYASEKDRVLICDSKNRNDIILDHFQNSITIDFSAMHFVAPEKNRFQYKLEGLDNDWNYTTGSNFAHYTNLSHGEYFFKVKASNNDGLWSDKQAVLKIKIIPPYWFSIWAYIFYSLICLFIAWGIRSFLLIKRKNREAQIREKEIEKINDLKLQFFTNISHDFKTPITLIINPIEELLASVSKNLELKPKFEMIYRNANYLLRLVNQLMEFRKIELGETKLNTAEGNIINFIKKITYSFKELASKKHIKLVFESEYDEIITWFDWDKLEKVLNNLLSNAFKSIENKGEIVIKVSKMASKKSVNFNKRNNINSKVEEIVRIEVKDNGRGIPSSQLENIFHRFYQVQEVYQNQNLKSGSGVGLAIAKDLVEIHYGNISVNSEEGSGSVFIIEIPLGKSHLAAEEMLGVSREDEKIIKSEDEFPLIDQNKLEEENTSKNKNTVLIIDDNEDILTIVKEGLAKNYEILAAENGKMGYEIAQKEIPDLIITDVLMPIMDGIELTKKLKSNIRTCHIPIIMLTTLSAVEHRIDGIESGAEVYLPKPFKMDLLKIRVDKLLETRELIYKRFKIQDTIKPDKIELNSIDQLFLDSIMELMEKQMSNSSYWVDELAADMNISRSTFFRKIKKLTGLGPNDFMRMIRLKRAEQLLGQGQISVTEVCYQVGFKDPNYFGKCFRKMFGKPPSQYSLK